jgi:hypothetical protein
MKPNENKVIALLFDLSGTWYSVSLMVRQDRIMIIEAGTA